MDTLPIRTSEDLKRERKRAKNRQWYATNRDRVLNNVKQWYAANRDRARENNRKWITANRERKREIGRKWAAAHPEVHRVSSRRWRAANPKKMREKGLKRLYGINMEMFEEMLRTQNNKCPICEGAISHSSPVDHDHESGRVRMILCARCNLGIGLLRDDPAITERASGYLRSFNGT